MSTPFCPPIILSFNYVRINASIACDFVGICDFLSLISAHIVSEMNDPKIVTVREFDIPRIFAIACVSTMQSTCVFKSVGNNGNIFEYHFSNCCSSHARKFFFVCADIL